MTVSDLAGIVGGDSLTDRELDVLSGAALGETSRQTADRLFLSVETVKHHKKLAIAKLEAPNMLRAVVLAISVGALNLRELVDD